MVHPTVEGRRTRPALVKFSAREKGFLAGWITLAGQVCANLENHEN